jgi:hypothetical protein
MAGTVDVAAAEEASQRHRSLTVVGVGEEVLQQELRRLEVAGSRGSAVDRAAPVAV